jgi:hypothetical protein
MTGPPDGYVGFTPAQRDNPSQPQGNTTNPPALRNILIRPPSTDEDPTPQPLTARVGIGIGIGIGTETL